MGGGPTTPVVRTTDGLAQVDGTTPKIFHGGNVDAGAAAVVEIRDGAVGGALLDTVRLAAAGVGDFHFSERGIATANGIWVEVVSGTPTVTVFVS
jgi:hypothetical protein